MPTRAVAALAVLRLGVATWQPSACSQNYPVDDTFGYVSRRAWVRALERANRRMTALVRGAPVHVIRTGLFGAETQLAYDAMLGRRSRRKTLAQAHVHNGLPTVARAPRARKDRDAQVASFTRRYLGAVAHAGAVARWHNSAPLVAKDGHPCAFLAYLQQDELLLRRGNFAPDDDPAARGRGDAGADANVFDARVLDPFRLAELRASVAQLRGSVAARREQPWTLMLAGKRVLVVSSMASDVARQYARFRGGGRIFSPAELLPRDMDLVTVEAPSTYRGQEVQNWTALLEDAERRIVAVGRVDVALISAGAYGLPLGHFVSQRGATAIYVGGALQLYFGLRGRRPSWRAEIRMHDVGDTIWTCPAKPAWDTSAMENAGPYWC